MEVWFSSDHHIGHKNILTFNPPRPFSDLEDMKEELIARHNDCVSPGDQVYFLGDMFWRTMDPAEAKDVLRRMQGQKHFIWGNHDELIEKHPELRDEFISIRQYQHIKQPNQPKGSPGIFLCHYAMRTWYKSHQGYWHLYGHSHGGLSNTFPDDVDYLSMDVGVDTNDFYPYSLTEIREIMTKTKVELVERYRNGHF